MLRGGGRWDIVSLLTFVTCITDLLDSFRIRTFCFSDKEGKIKSNYSYGALPGQQTLLLQLASVAVEIMLLSLLTTTATTSDMVVLYTYKSFSYIFLFEINGL